jgi:hypothetical protein
MERLLVATQSQIAFRLSRSELNRLIRQAVADNPEYRELDLPNHRIDIDYDFDQETEEITVTASIAELPTATTQLTVLQQPQTSQQLGR